MGSACVGSELDKRRKKKCVQNRNMWAHDGHVHILPTSLYWPMIATCIFSRLARIGLIQPIMYLTIYTSGTIGGSLCYCRLTCNGPQQVATAAEHMSCVGP